MSFRNRCVIAGADGPVILSIPLQEGREQRKPVKEVLIDYKKPWQAQHWKTIVSCYNRSPWFEFYRDEAEELFSQKPPFLYEWNWACLNWISARLEWPVPANLTQAKQMEPSPLQYHDFRGQLMPATIQNRFPDPVRYRQVFEERTGFLPHLSILDLLFCEGRQALKLISGQDLDA